MGGIYGKLAGNWRSYVFSAEKISETFLSTYERTVYNWKIAPEKPWLKGYTSCFNTLLMYQFLFRLPRICSKFDCPWCAIISQTIQIIHIYIYTYTLNVIHYFLIFFNISRLMQECSLYLIPNNVLCIKQVFFYKNNILQYRKVCN